MTNVQEHPDNHVAVLKLKSMAHEELDSQLFFNRPELELFVSHEVPFKGERRNSEEFENCLWHREIEEKQLKVPVSLFLSLSSAWQSGSWRTALILSDSGRTQLQTAPAYRALPINGCY